jgi:hypothetical protein
MSSVQRESAENERSHSALDRLHWPARIVLRAPLPRCRVAVSLSLFFGPKCQVGIGGKSGGEISISPDRASSIGYRSKPCRGSARVVSVRAARRATAATGWRGSGGRKIARSSRLFVPLSIVRPCPACCRTAPPPSRSPAYLLLAVIDASLVLRRRENHEAQILYRRFSRLR